jgi:RNA polymerase sigma-70 factor, ECF subfamily
METSTVLEAAQGGDETAFAKLLDPYRGELHAHCYRMLGSVHDAEDALQEVSLRAWRALGKFEGRSSLRSRLYTIATNTCLNAIAKRPKRVLPIDYGPEADPHRPPGAPLAETVWIEPYPDELLGVEQRESVELAFVAALQHLPANQRAVLILREVLDFSAKETAEALDTSVASVNSALQRARAAVEERVPEQSQQETLRALGDEEVRRLVDRYVDAWDRQDVEAFASMLAEDATFSMPPMSRWYRGREAISIWAANSPLSGDWRWKTVLTQANGQPALAFYAWDPDEGAYMPFGLNVITFRGAEVADVTAFLNRSIEDPSDEAMAHMPEQPEDARMTASAFENFRLPKRLD